MNQFWLEFFYFIVAAFAILVSISAASLFILTFRFERRLRTVWRATGFLLLALAFFILVLERKYSQVALMALVVEFLAFFCIFRGVLAEPILSHLGKDPEKGLEKNKAAKAENFKITRLYLDQTKDFVDGIKRIFNKKFLKRVVKDLSELFSSAKKANGKGSNVKLTPEALKTRKQGFWASIVFAIIVIALVLIYIFYHPFIYSALVASAFVCILATIPIQLKRFAQEKKDIKSRKQNLYPLIGYIFLFLSMIALFFYRLPDLNIVFLRQLKLEYGVTWILAMLLTFLGFLFLAVWAWNFIKLRVFLRTFVVFLTATIIVSALGSLIFTVLIFGTVETNNLRLMAQGAQTQRLIMVERSNNALALAKNISEDEKIASNILSKNSDKVQERINQFSANSQIDILRIYDSKGKILQDLNDPRNIGKVFNQDPILAYVLNNKKHIQSFSADPGVLAYVMNARGLAPILSNGNVIGAIEVGYKFDNAFVDFSKKQTGLDVTIYTGSKIATTTIETINGVSRWVGTLETNQTIVQNVLEKGESYSVTTDRLGQIYYNSFEPVRDVNGIIIGMVSVGAPTSLLFESTRQELISAFLIMTIISLIVVLIAYFAISQFQRRIS